MLFNMKKARLLLNYSIALSGRRRLVSCRLSRRSLSIYVSIKSSLLELARLVDDLLTRAI